LGAVTFPKIEKQMKSNCSYTELHKNDIGKISLCNSCGNLEVEIGHLMSLISPEPFQLILADFKERLAFYENNRIKDFQLEPILICLNKNNLYLKLSETEFNEVLELFEMASHMLSVNQLMTTN
tara:strand:+ start:14783 stop:15154 length:372 start_codon:yes stop_codon:yes gene_type:complete